MTEFLFDFSQEVWNDTYKNNLLTSIIHKPDQSVRDTLMRVAMDLASEERDSEKWTKLFFEALSDFKCVPGGRILSNMGTNLKGTTAINCFVSGATGGDQDSIEGIFDTLTRAAKTLKSEGGYGFCCSFIRPKGSFIYGVGVESPGAIEMLNLWDTMSSVITKGSGKKKKKEEGKNKIRKGAMLVSIHDSHPDLEDFITAKRTPGVLNKFNMSILISDELINAVKNNQKWDLWFPDTTFEKYKDEWDGDLRLWAEKGYPKIIYKTYTNANELWDIIMKSTYNYNEPGVLFVDRINSLNNLHLTERILSTNPCGEQCLPIGGVCLLGSLNLTQFVNKDRTNWDYDKLKQYIPIFVRLLDNVNDRTIVPLEEQRQNLKNKRRIGVGYMGYGSALYLMKVCYGSKKALKLTTELCSFVTNEVYKASSLLAHEKGSYPLFNLDEFLSAKFPQQALDKETIELIMQYGLRNSHLTSIQPTGNSSILANNVSGGLEPIFMPEYVRTKVVSVPPEGLLLPIVDWDKKTFFTRDLSSADERSVAGTTWRWIKEGDEDLLFTEFESTTYKFDRNRGLTKETLVEDYAVHLLKQEGEWDPKADWAVDTSKLSVSEHTTTMKTFAKYIDSAMSKTINLPNDYPYEDFKKLYMDMYDSGVIKGGTTYRAGTMTTVLAAKETKVDSTSRITKTVAPKRPKELECDVHRLTVDGHKWIVFVGLIEGDPYEVFAGTVSKVDLGKKITKGKMIKMKQGEYNFTAEDEVEIKDIVSVFDHSTQGAITRLVSTSLRHGADIKYIVSQLQKTGNGLNTFAKALSRVLKKYIKEGAKLDDQTCPSCESKELIMAEGCNKCLSCGYSGCS
jgi:ribonucleoside-diphosphate reductase alpha chain